MTVYYLEAIDTFYFKHPWTGQNFIKKIDTNIEINKLDNIIKNEIRTILNITGQYEFVEAGTYKKELANAIITNTNKKMDEFNRGFYVRPTDVPIPEKFLNRIELNTLTYLTECIICYKNNFLLNSENWECGHNSIYCFNCINTWRQTCLRNNNRITTCPICRSVI